MTTIMPSSLICIAEYCCCMQAQHRGGLCPAGPAPASPLVPKTITAARSTTQPQSQPLDCFLRSLAAQYH
jgi:hypothetical protein